MNSRRFLATGIVLLVIVGAALLPDVRSALLPNGGATVALGPPRFVEETSSAGIDHLYEGAFEYAAGGGVAAFDCSGDGKPDLYFAGAERPAALYRNDSPIGGALRFTPLPDPATDLVRGTGAYPIDIDGYGIVVLVVLRNGDNVLLLGLGGCRFE